MKTLKNTSPVQRFIIYLSVILLIFAYLLHDDSLSPESKLLLEEQPKHVNNTGYYYLMGIMAAEDENPLEVGKNIYASIVAGEEASKNKREFIYDVYPENRKLILPTGKLFCSDWKNNCLLQLFLKIDEFDEEKYETLLSRYQHLIRISKHQTPSKPSLKEITPPYQYVIKGSRINFLKNIKTASNGNPEVAILNLLEDITLIRKKMETADNIIEKIMYVYILSHTIDVLYVIQKKYQTKDKITLSNLTITEIDLTDPFKREFKGLRNFCIDQSTIPEARLTKMVAFKPNMTTNELSKRFSKIISLSKLEPYNFSIEMKNYSKNKNSFSIRNLAGSFLINIEPPNYENFIARVIDLNIKISIFNRTLTLTPNEIKNLEIENPYHKRKEKLVENKNVLCATGPLSDPYAIRCIPKLN